MFGNQICFPALDMPDHVPFQPRCRPGLYLLNLTRRLLDPVFAKFKLTAGHCFQDSFRWMHFAHGDQPHRIRGSIGTGARSSDVGLHVGKTFTEG